MRVQNYMQAQHAPAAQIGVVAGSAGLAIPSMDAANHIAGWLQDGMLFIGNYNPGAQGTGRQMTYRHPDCDDVAFWFYVTAVGSAVASITVNAGGGGPVATWIPRAPHSFWVTAPWGPTAGWAEISWACVDCHIGAVSVFGVPRSDMTVTNDMCADRSDPTYLQGGLGEGQVIMSDGTSAHHVSGTAETLEEAFDYSLPTACAQCGHMEWTLAGGGIGVWGYVTGIGPWWQHRAQTWRATDTDQLYRCFVRARRSVGAGNYTWRWRSVNTGSTVTWGPGADAALTWRYVDGLRIDCTADDQIVFEAAADVGTTLAITDVTVRRWTP